ncbi:hypothetical protein SRS16CHR_01805 [Variovorax sp. SRS16]|uniref:hypothetical protein n=1 Tax=Variovorax sp. SRS16 TaxID=282217 RepID=UPI0013170F2F|nr:hypothetical protein [Variovorax sp. SRS16]VTU16554.1 hypothetical protein SRS16CHR_01805 [Variovorax sp. SRS16]
MKTPTLAGAGVPGNQVTVESNHGPDRATNIAIAQQFSLTVLSSRSNIGKRITIGSDGKLAKGPLRMPIESTARRHTVGSLREFDALLQGLPPTTAITHGVPPADVCTITTQEKLTSAAPGTIARDGAHFAWPDGPAFLLADSDFAPTDPDPVAEDIDRRICLAVPAWANVTRLYRSSGSSHVIDAELGLPLRGVAGLHGYVGVDRAADIPEIGQRIFDRLILAGEGCVRHARSGTPLVRTLVDSKVWQPERLDFHSADLGAGLEQEIPPGQVFEATDHESRVSGDRLLSLADIPPLTDAEKASVEQIKQVLVAAPAVVAESARLKHLWATEKAREAMPMATDEDVAAASAEIANRAASNQLFGGFVITLSDGTRVTVDEVCADPLKYHDRRCHDPLDDEGDKRIGVILGKRTNGSGGVALHSHMHGGRMFDLVSSAGFDDAVEFDDHPVTESHTITIRNGERARIVAEVAEALGRRAPYYRRGEMLVRANSLPADEDSAGIRRSGGSVVLREAKSHAIVADVSRVARVEKFDARAKKMVPADLPDAVALSLCALGVEQRAFRPVIGVTRCPVMSEDGSLRAAAGYDPSTKLILAGDDDWSLLDIPATPTQEDALRALAWLLDTAYRDFPYADAESKSVALSALLTAVIRPALDCAPLHAFSAPQYGAGKSLQATLAAVVATGTKPTTVAPGHSQEEFEKRVDATIIAGDPVVMIDNLSRPLGGDNLCMALTSPIATIRPLGTSVQITTPTAAFWMATGQNFAAKRDMHRRTVVGYIDAGMERPETRSGFAIPNLIGWATENRMRILSAVFTMLRAHAMAGYPSMGEKTLGSFEAWSRRVAHCLVWLRLVNPVRSQDRLRDDDPEIQGRTGVFSALHDWQQLRERCMARSSWTLRDLRALYNDPQGAARDLCDAIAAGVSRGVDGMPSWLRMNKNVTIGIDGESFCLLNCGTGHGGGSRWEIVRSGSGATPGDHGDDGDPFLVTKPKLSDI